MAGGDPPQPLHQLEVLGELGLAELLAVPAPVVRGQRRDPLPRHRAGEQAGGHRRVHDHPDPFPLGDGEELHFDPAVDQRVRRLQGLHRRDGLRSPKLSGVEVRHADVAHHPALLQLGERRPALLDLLIGDRPVDLVEVDGLDAEALAAALHLAQQRVAPEAPCLGPPRSLGQPALGEDVGARFDAGQGAPDDPFRVPEAILRRGVDPVHPESQGAVDRRDRVLVILRSPPPLVATASDRPGAEADAGDLETGGAQLSCPQRRGRHGVSYPTVVSAGKDGPAITLIAYLQSK